MRTAQANRPVSATRCRQALQRWRGAWLAALLLSAPLHAAGPEYRFERIGIDDGLSQASARVVLEDRRGLIWVGTQEGLNRYDGYSIKAWQHDPTDPHSLSDNNVVALHEDAQGVLWIGTLNGGLNRFDPRTGRFARFLPDAADGDGLSDRWVRSIASDPHGGLWLGTARGLDRFDNGRFQRYRHASDNPHSLSHDAVRSLAVDAGGALWVGTDGGGLNRLEADGRFTRFRHRPGDDGGPSHDVILALAADAEGVLWIGTDGAGVDRYDPASGRFSRLAPADDGGTTLDSAPIQALQPTADGRLWIATRGNGIAVYDPGHDRLNWLQHRPALPYSLSHNTAWSLHADSSGLLWIGTADSLNRFDPRTLRFGHYRRHEGDPYRLSHDWVRSFVEDRDGTLWIGTQEGLNRWDAITGRFTAYHRATDAPDSRKADHARALARHPDGGLWVGSDAGLDHFDPANGRFTRVPLRTTDDPAPSPDRVASLFVDHDRSLWVGTHETGLIHLGADGRPVRRYQRDPARLDSLSHNQVRVIHRDRSGRLWLGTWGGGLCRLDAQQHSFHCHRHDPADPDSLGSDVVRGIHEDAEGRFWLATQGGGLAHFDPETGLSRSVTRRDGLADDSIYGVLPDARGRLWISSNGGLSRLDPRDGGIRNYTVRDGLQSSEYNTGAYLRTARGELLFGGIGGFNRFDPEHIEDDLRPPRVLLTELLLANRPVPVGGRADGFALTAPLDVLDTLTLAPQQRQFSIEFAALHYSDPRRNRFAYRLRGFDDEWIATDARNRRATYTNLPPGRYTLQVRASNPQGVWSEAPAELAITLLPAPWETLWARLLYAAGLLLLGALALRWRDARVSRQALRLQALVDQRTAELQQSHSELERASLIDPLTGLGNRRLMIRGLQQQAFPPPQRQALMLLDIDHFKAINDSHGHAVGDAVLCALARQLKASCRRDDLAARWGGEEFLLRIAVDDESDAVACAERLRRAVAALRVTRPDGGELGITCSIGVACLPFDPAQPTRLDWERVLLIADAALYLAKHGGRDAVVCLASGGRIEADFERRIGSHADAMVKAGTLRILRPGA